MGDPPLSVDPADNSLAAGKTELHLFEGFGVELEYMIADQTSLDVSPIADQLIAAECGSVESEITVDELAWSNELALHVIELKTPHPVSGLCGLADLFQHQVKRINRHLRAKNSLLLPSAMHPWMDPDREMKLWTHDYSDVYEAFHRIFNCRGHGWANLQSVHLNLPFCGDEEFARLHAAIRIVLPILPGIAASSPFVDGKATGLLDNRLEVYRTNSSVIPSVCGQVIPEQAFSRADYQRLILGPMFAEIAPFDPDGVLQNEFLNARGAIARFSRGSIEIRVIDIQECPAADLAVLQLCVAAIRHLTDETVSSLQAQQQIGVKPLHELLLNVIRDADAAVISDPKYLELFGYHASETCTVSDLWRFLAETIAPSTDSATSVALNTILSRGPLARRLLHRSGRHPDRIVLRQIYSQLAEALAAGKMFV